MKKQTKLGLVLAAAALISVSVASLVQAKGWVQEGAEWRYVGNDGDFVTDTIQTSGNAKFYLNEDGYMAKDFFLEDFDNANYYFGANGAMVTNTWVAIESGNVNNQGDGYVPDNYWYYFQASGKAVKGSSGNPKKMTIDGKRYLFNEYGQMCTGWVSKEGEIQDPNEDTDGGPFMNADYYAGGDNDGALRSGWVTYYDGYNNANSEDVWYSEKTTLYFYFNPTTNKMEKKESAIKEKKINGKTYAFDSTGMMLSGWDKVDIVDFDNKKDSATYFSGEDDGHKVKKGWVYAVPAKDIDEGAYDDGEEKYFYFNGSGDAVRDQFKKINGKTYAFNHHGIMKTGIVIWCPGEVVIDAEGNKQKFIDTVDLDWADGEKIAKGGKIYVGDGKGITVDSQGNWLNDFPGTGNDAYVSHLTAGDTIQLHYFGEDGARKTNANTINFADDAYTFFTTTSGHKPSGESKKKYYSLGIQCKASLDVKYGIFDVNNSLAAQQTDYLDGLYTSFDYTDTSANIPSYKVLNTSGTLQTGSRSSKKDANDNYWLISGSDMLEGIYTVDVRRVDSANVGKITATLSEMGITMDPVSGSSTKYYVKISEIVNNLSSIDEKGAESLTKTIFGVAQNINDGLVYDASSIEANIDDDGYLIVDNITGADDVEKYNVTYHGYQFKADRKDKTVWMAFGAKDNVGKTASQLDPTLDDYRVELDNSYFLNCYWDTLN